MTAFTLNDIDARTKTFADARSKLADLVTVFTGEKELLERKHMTAIRRQIARVAELQKEVEKAVDATPSLFKRPKTVLMHGIRVGFEKGRGKLVYEDVAKLISRIELKLPEKKDLLIKTTKKPVAKAIQQLTVEQLKSIGCQIHSAGDGVVVRAEDSAIEKLVKVLLKGADGDDDED